MKKKLLVFHPFLTTYRLDLYNFLNNYFDLRVVLYMPNIQTLAFDKEALNQKANFSFVYLKDGKKIAGQIISMGLFDEINQFRPDIVMPHEFGFNALVAIWMQKKWKYKIFITNDDSPSIAETTKGIRNFLRNYCLNRINGLIAVNPETPSVIQSKHLNTKCRFFYFPIIQDEQVFLSKINDAGSIAHSYSEDLNLENKFVFFFVGRLVKVKGIDLLLTAFSEISKQIENAHLILVGDGLEKNNLQKMAADLGLDKVVSFVGKKSDLALVAYFKVGHVLVLPSRFEPFGAVVNEALVAGCRVVVSSVVGAKCLITNNAGFIFDSENVNDLQNKMLLAYQASLKDKSKSNCMPFGFNEKTKELIEFIYEN